MLLKIKYLIYAMFVYLHMDINVFKVFILFMILDSFSGVLKVVRLDVSKFSFKALLWGLSSKMAFLILPLSVALLGKGLDIDLSMGAQLIARILIVSEFLSFFGNLYTAKTGKVVKDIDIFTMIYYSVRTAGIGFIKGSLSKVEKLGSCEIKDDEDDENSSGRRS